MKGVIEMIELKLESPDPYYQIRDAACITEGKRAKKRDKLLGDERDFCERVFTTKHSILRAAHFTIIATVRTDVEHQLLRATKGSPQPYCQSKRPDWNQGKARLPDDQSYSLFGHQHTAESFMDECNQRLCFRAMKETREEVLRILKAMDESGVPFFEALALCCVPSCVAQYGCPENSSCHWFSPDRLPSPIPLRYRSYALWRRTLGVPDGSI